MKVVFRETVYKDIEYLAANLRTPDLAEIKAGSGGDPLKMLTQGFIGGEVCTSAINERNEVVAVAGIVPSRGCGIIWMMATDGIEECSLSFLRQSRPYMAYLQTLYPMLYNTIDSRNDLHLKWVKWLGFKFINTIEEYGVEKRKFYEIVRI